ncbi:probable serine/threonine-protein kinase DDB_G0282963 [Eupeodes corollae]|uniref:probable serine/threonine-protein kinase DDB_G0282963 n=1 Tax=Eupeodes corollae TaxID=290404 RepID=UPI00248FAE57|nr:probable serine/threonine-protein kinase DDB_G0282963 [Eupeodes corollae]
MASPDSNSSSSLTALEINTVPVAGFENSPKSQMASFSALRKEHTSSVSSGDTETSHFRSLASPFSHQMDTTTPSPPNVNFDIPQWKKDLIQRRKTNIAKTIAAATGNSAKEDTIANVNSTDALGSVSPNCDSKNGIVFTNNNNSSDKLLSSSSINTNDTNKSNTSQNSITNNSKTIINNVVKTPVTTQTTQLQQQKVKIEFLCGGHYTQVNNKPSASGDSIHHYTEKLQTRSASVLQSQSQCQSQSQQLASSVLVSRSVVVGSIEKNIYDGNGSSSTGSTTLPQPQENVRFRKKFTDQRGTINSSNSNTSTTSTTTTTTTSSDSAVSDSLLTSKSRLSSGLKVAAEAEVEFSKKNNNDNNSSGLCVSDEQQKHNLHIFQQKPDLTTNMSKDNNNDNGGGDGEQGEDDEYHQNQLICRRESDSSSSACVVSLNDFDSKDTDSKLFSTTEHKYKTTNVSCLTPSSSAPLKSLPGAGIGIIKKPCGIESDSVRSSSGSLPFIKNQNIGNVNTIGSTHHNYKINTKVRCSNQNQNQNTSLAPSVLKTTAASNESSSKSVTNNNTKKMVAVRDMNEITKNELDFDPSEELQYGPGIVSKLRCRYLSLALRQSMDKQRLSIDSLRRATSLNNLLDEKCVHEEDDDEYDTSDNINKETTSPSVAVSQVGSKGTTSSETVIGYGYKRNSKDTPENITCPTGLSYNNQHRSRHIKRGNDSLKRARSVEALLCEKSPWNFSNSQLSNETNAAASDVVTIDDKINNARERLLSGTDSNPPKRLASIIDDTERPPPDLVKQTLKIFEASTNRRSRTTNRNSGEVATKVANYKFIITQNKPAITFPKPPVSPKKPNQKSKPITSEAVNNIIATPSPIIVSPIQQADKIVSPLSSTPTPKSRSINKKTTKSKTESTPIRNVGTASSVLESLSDNSPDIIPRHKFFEKTATPLDSPVTEITKSIEKLRIESPTTPTQSVPLQTPSFKDRHSKFSSESSERDSEDDDDDDESLDGEYVVNVEEKQISKSALENIAKAGSSQQFIFADNHASSNLNGDSPAPTYLHDIPTVSTSSSSTNTVKQIGIIRPLLAEPRHSKIKNNSTEEISFNQVQPALTSREIEKNKINNEKKVEISGGENISMAKITGSIVTSSLNKIDVARNEDDNNSQALGWSSAIIPRKKRTAAGSLPENNTMIFNFKDRKEVPDYIENDGLIFKHKRELPKPNESGFVLLDDLSLETSTDPDDEWSMCPPSPCDVEFENANIIIDGKSNIKIGPKESNFHVQFNDTLTSTFEYPSESSMIADSDSVYADLSSFDASRSPCGTTTDGLSEEIESPVVHHHVKSEEIIQLPHNNKVLGNLSLGSAPLGSYTPITAKTENMFQLGVTREPSSQLVKTDDANSNEKPPADFYGESSLEYLKPASDDLTIAYSEGSLKTDLLY